MASGGARNGLIETIGSQIDLIPPLDSPYSSLGIESLEEVELTTTHVGVAITHQLDLDHQLDCDPLEDQAPAINAINIKSFRWAVLYFYFCLGVALTFPVLSVKKIMMDDLKFEPAEMAILWGWTSVPWTIKPLYGFISDSYPIFGLRRRPYLALGILLNVFGWIGMAWFGHASRFGVASLLTVSSLGLVIADVAADSLVVENVKLERNGDEGKLQSGVWISRAFGSMLASATSGIAFDVFGATPRELILTTGLVSLTGFITAKFTYEEPVSRSRFAVHMPFTQRIRELFGFWKRPVIWRACLFIFLFAATPSGGDAFFYFMRNQLGFSMGLLGWLSVVRYAASVGAVYFFRQRLRHIPFRKLLTWSIVIACALGFTTLIVVLRWNLLLHIPDAVFVFGDTVFLAAAAEIAMMPIVIFAAQIAPRGAEGTVYASLISVSNLSGILSETSGGWLTDALGVHAGDYSNLWLLLLICNLSTLLPLPFICLVPEITTHDHTENSIARDIPAYEPLDRDTPKQETRGDKLEIEFMEMDTRSSNHLTPSEIDALREDVFEIVGSDDGDRSSNASSLHQ